MMSEIELRQLVDRFWAKTLPKEEWTHLAHLIVGLHTVQQHDVETAISKMREGIKGYNVAVGGENTDQSGYHESITIFFCHALTAFSEEMGEGWSFETLVDRLEGSRLVDGAFMFDFYTRKRLFSVEARLNWVAPDLRPLGDWDRVMFDNVGAGTGAS